MELVNNTLTKSPSIFFPFPELPGPAEIISKISFFVVCFHFVLKKYFETFYATNFLFNSTVKRIFMSFWKRRIRWKHFWFCDEAFELKSESKTSKTFSKSFELSFKIVKSRFCGPPRTKNFINYHLQTTKEIKKIPSRKKLFVISHLSFLWLRPFHERLQNTKIFVISLFLTTLRWIYLFEVWAKRRERRKKASKDHFPLKCFR